MNFRLNPLFFMLIILPLLLAACGGGGGGGGGSASNGDQDLSDYQFRCEATTNFTPSQAPLSYPVSGAATSVIVIHGKSGSPAASHLTPLYADLQAAGYNVIAAYMPWGHNGNSPALWTGDLCQAMQYVDSLVSSEQSAGRQVVLIGHSMGGAGALIYNATADVSAVDASISIAPGHFMHYSGTLQSQTAASVSAARAMVTAGEGDVSAAFQTYNSGALQDVTTTANIFLSFHGLEQYPEIVDDVLGAISGPLFWIGGSQDPLTNNFGYASLFNSYLPSNAGNQYQTIDGDHKSVVANASTQIIDWITDLGL